MTNTSSKFDEEAHKGLVSIEEAHKGLVSIIFTSLFPYMCIVTLTFDLQNQ